MPPDSSANEVVTTVFPCEHRGVCQSRLWTCENERIRVTGRLVSADICRECQLTTGDLGNTSSFLGNRNVRVGYIYPRWSSGGTTRGIITLVRHGVPGVTFVGAAIKSFTLFDQVGQQQCSLPIWCGEAPSDKSRYPGVTFTDSFDAACHEVLNRCDIVILWGFSRAEAAFERLKQGEHAVIVTTHGTCASTRRMVEAIGSYATHPRAVSQAAAALWKGYTDLPVTVVYNGVDLNRCVPLVPREVQRQRWGALPHEILIGHVGRLKEDKQPLSVAEVVQLLGEPYRAVYVGDGLQANIVRTRAQEMLGNRAIFAGRVEQIGNALGALDCWLMASPSEGHCQSLNEAWAAGVPAVSTRVGAVPELEALYGPLVASLPTNPTPVHMAQAIHQALDPRHRDIIRNAQKLVRERFTASHMADAFRRHISSITKSFFAEAPIRLLEKSPAGLNFPASATQLRSQGREFSLVITISRPELYRTALEAAQALFPPGSEIIAAVAPKIKAEVLPHLLSLSNCRLVVGADTPEECDAALFRAMDEATGQWIVHLDDDDVWVQCDHQLISGVPADVGIVSGGALYVNHDPSAAYRQRVYLGVDDPKLEDLADSFGKPTPILPGSFRVTRRSCWEKIRPRLGLYPQYNDYRLLIAVLHSGYRLRSVNEIWGVVRRFPRPKRKRSALSWPEVFQKTLRELESSKSVECPWAAVTEPTSPRQTQVRVGLVTHSLQIGGAEKWLATLAKHLPRHGIAVSGVVMTGMSPIDVTLATEITSTTRLVAVKSSSREGTDVRFRSNRFREYDEEAQAIQSIAAEVDVWLTWGAPRPTSAVHRTPQPIILCSRTARPSGRESCTQYSHLAAVSKAAMQYLAGRPGHCGRPITVIGNGIDLENLASNSTREEMRSRWNVPAPTIAIGYVGRFSVEKNPWAAVRTAIKLGAGHIAVYAGYQPVQAKTPMSLNINHWLDQHPAAIRYLGLVSHIGDVYRGLDCVIAASAVEGFSRTVCEAWLTGVPVIATRVGAIPELEALYGPMTVSVAANPSDEELAAAVKLATSRETDSIRRRAFDVASREFTADNMSRQWSHFIMSCVQANSSLVRT